jgi:hypothetical protein
VVPHGGGCELRLRHQEALPERRPRLTPERQEPVAKRHVVCPDDPADPYGREGVQRHERRVDGPLLLNDAAIEDNQPWHALQAHESRRCHLPCVIALVEPVWR